MMKLAIFDLDRTLLAANSSYQSATFAYFCHRAFSTPLATLHQNHFDEFFAGKQHQIFEEQAQLFVEECCTSLIYAPAFRRLVNLRDNGHYVVILSGSPTFLVKPMAKHFGIAQGVGTEYAVDAAGHFSHVSHVMDGPDKAQFAQEIAEELEISRRDIEAYSDSHFDLPLLQIAGKAVGVNPNKKLRKLCISNGWEIL
jgi:HAD superfamily hydrolase (TIGR01490 family)